jgi:uncharacterized SAM-binding protein YcdF (DUF218 family)
LLVALPAVAVLRPATDRPAPADAVVSLSGGLERLPRAAQLVADGMADVLVVAGTTDSALHERLCRGDQRFEVLCPRPEPDTTRNEARNVAQLAASRHWRTLVVVTSKSHVARARLLFSRCFDGSLKVVAAEPLPGGTVTRKQRLHEWAGLLYARYWSRGC